MAETKCEIEALRSQLQTCREALAAKELEVEQCRQAALAISIDSAQGRSLIAPFCKSGGHGRVVIKALLETAQDHIGKKLTVAGWIKRSSKGAKGEFAFVHVSDGSTPRSLQVLVTPGVIDLDRVKHTGVCIVVEGIVRASPGAKQSIELEALKICHVGRCDPITQEGSGYPIPHEKTQPKLEALRALPHLRSRTTAMQAVARVRSGLSFATHEFFQQRGFLYLHSPLITSSDCEGAGEMFQVTTLLGEADGESGSLPRTKEGGIDYAKDFFMQKAYLAVSGQLEAECYACSMSSVYTFGPSFRAEESHTTRHLAEFWMIEPEICFADLHDAMECAEEFVRFCCERALDRCLPELEFLEKTYETGCVERLHRVLSTCFARCSYTKAIEILEAKVEQGHKFEKPVFWGCDLASEHERYLAETHFGCPTIVHDYPKEIKSFYMRLSDDGRTVAAMDVLVPGIGELIGGSQREERLEVLEQRYREAGLDAGSYSFYTDLRRFGTAKHSGFGLGLDRLVLFTTGVDSVRDVMPFPRWHGHVA